MTATKRVTGQCLLGERFAADEQGLDGDAEAGDGTHLFLGHSLVVGRLGPSTQVLEVVRQDRLKNRL